ncbi:MAG: response regulator [Candidatus Omnitrophica bacterium]|nr:response regulator [Candidatus Omnitrophota bacterium]
MSKNILVVDESTTILNILSLALRFKGHIVKVVGNGKEALLALEKEKFDVAVIDLMVPVMDGCELLLRIRNDDRLKDIPTIILTEANNEKMKTKAAALGASCFILKPFHPKEFMDKVEELLEEEHL